MKEKDNNKVKLSEKISLNLGRKIFVNSTKTFLIIAILVAAYIALNLGLQQVDLPKIDITKNKIYTLSDASKKAVSGINQNVLIYVYGIEENDSLIDLLKQYHKANEKISYEMLTSESNYDLVQEYGLQEGYRAIIIKSGDAKKIIDASSGFITYDSITYQSVDTAEQTLTNSILAVAEEIKPKIYFVDGHGEYKLNSDLGLLAAYLKNEAYETATLNLVSEGEVPDDCNILAIMSPSTDLVESEAQAIKNYINKGGKIYFSTDTVAQSVSLPNFASVLSEYGVSVENGYIVEQGSNGSSKYPYVIMPEMSSTNKITSDLYSNNGKIYMMYASKLNFVSDDELQNLGITKEILLNSSDNAYFVTDLSSNYKTALSSAQQGKFDISAVLTKKISSSSETTDTENSDESNSNSDTLESKLIIVTCGNFITDYKSPLDDNYPLSYLGNNKDFVINAMSVLGDKGNTLTIRKDITTATTYVPTDNQSMVVLAIVLGVPVLIIIIGFVIWHQRKKRK